MRMANDVPIGVDLLGSGVVIGLGVDEVPGFKIVDRH
jgi:hypothetical protein